jgi:hypothetical protein
MSCDYNALIKWELLTETLGYARDGDAGKILDGGYAFGEEGVGEVFGVWFELGEAAECPDHMCEEHELLVNPGSRERKKHTQRLRPDD